MQSTQRVIRPLLAFAALCGFGVAAPADDAAAPALPSLALSPPALPTLSPQTPSIWSGLYVGSEIFAISGGGAKGRAGGGGFVGYNHEFANNFVVGIEGAAGYSPAWFQPGPFKGYDYGAANVRLGYDMGRFMPYVTTGVVLAKPTLQAGSMNAADLVNDLFAPSSNVKAGGTVGVGVDYAVTSHLTVSVGASVGRGPAAFGP